MSLSNDRTMSGINFLIFTTQETPVIPRRYHPSLRILHWLIAGLILTALILGTFVMAPADSANPEKAFALLKHMLAGMAVLALTLLRIFIRPKTRRPAPALSGIAVADRMIPFVHRVFDLLALAMVVSGISIGMLNHLPDIVVSIVFDGRGHLPSDYSGHLLYTLHVGIARLLAGIVALHIAGALYHQFILRDRLFSRMALVTGRSKA